MAAFIVKEQADLDEGTNFIIYGHNMKDGSMFGDLDLYLKESFYKEHPTVSFDTLYEERTYETVAVFRSQDLELLAKQKSIKCCRERVRQAEQQKRAPAAADAQ